MNNLELIKFAESKIGTAYVYGMKGKVMTANDYNRLKKQYGSMVWDTDIKKIGKMCVDCSGLISWATGIVRGSSQYKQMAKEAHPISTIEDAPKGAAVWRNGHIGIYVGNGDYIAADGSAYGVRKNNLSNAKFTHWFEISDIEYVEGDEMKRYNKVEELPAWARPVIQKLVNEKRIADGNNLNLSEDMVRVLVIMNR